MFKDELNEALMSEKPSVEINGLIEEGKIQEYMPELIRLRGFEQKNPHHDKDVFMHTMVVVDSVEPDLVLRMAALLHDVSKPDCFTIDSVGVGHFRGHHIKSALAGKAILDRLNYDSKFVSNVIKLVRFHYIKDIDMSEEGINKFISDIGTDSINGLFRLIIADIKGKADPHDFRTVKQLMGKCLAALKGQA